MSLVEERECLRVEGRGRSSCAKREPEGARPPQVRAHQTWWKRERKDKAQLKLIETEHKFGAKSNELYEASPTPTLIVRLILTQT